MTTRLPKARIVYDLVSKDRPRLSLEQEISGLVAQGYQIAGMSQSEDQEGTWLTILLTKA